MITQAEGIGGRSYLMRILGETSWEGPFGPCRDLTAAAMLFARLKRLQTGRSITLQIATGSKEIREVRVERETDKEGGIGYTIHLEADG